MLDALYKIQNSYLTKHNIIVHCFCFKLTPAINQEWLATPVMQHSHSYSSWRQAANSMWLASLDSFHSISMASWFAMKRESGQIERSAKVWQFYAWFCAQLYFMMALTFRLIFDKRWLNCLPEKLDWIFFHWPFSSLWY